MLDIFTSILDTIIPPHKSILTIRGETPERFKRFYLPQKVFGCVYLSDYSQKKLKMAITANKFHNHKPASRLLASLLEEWIKQQPEEKLIFIPIPLSKNRERERGYNQVARILKNVKDEKIAIEPLLTRTKNTTPQTKLDRDLRLHNVTGVFAYQKPSVKLTDQHLVLIDDVVTTGATMKEAGKILKQNLPKNCRLTLLALAH